MKKLVSESLQELLEWISSEENQWADEQIDDYLGVSKEETPVSDTAVSEELPVEEWEDLIERLIDMNNGEAAFMKLEHVIKTHPSMQIRGRETPIPEQYMPGLVKLVEFYKEHIQKDFNIRMN